MYTLGMVTDGCTQGGVVRYTRNGSPLPFLHVFHILVLRLPQGPSDLSLIEYLGLTDEDVV